MLTEQQRSDFDWYVGALADLYERYGRCHALISDEQVLGTYATFGDACRAADALCESGCYIVQEVGPDEGAYTDSLVSLWVQHVEHVPGSGSQG